MYIRMNTLFFQIHFHHLINVIVSQTVSSKVFLKLLCKLSVINSSVFNSFQIKLYVKHFETIPVYELYINKWAFILLKDKILD